MCNSIKLQTSFNRLLPCEIQFSEVSAVVHVAEVVDVGSGADGVGHGLISHSNWTSEYGSQPKKLIRKKVTI